MRSLWTVLSVLLLLHVLLLAGGAVWLNMTDRLSNERLQEVISIFSPTMAEAETAAKELKSKQAEDAIKAQEVARQKRIGDGPANFQREIDERVVADEFAVQQSEVNKRDAVVLQRNLTVARELLTKERKQLDADRKKFDELIEKEAKKRTDEDFKLAVEMYEQLKAKQTKEIFQQLMTREKTDDVVRYLAAMQTRKAAAVLKEFKNAADIPQVTDLIQRLRDRGVNLLSGVKPSLTTASGAT